MLTCIPGVLTREEVERLRAALATGEYSDGKLTAGKVGQHAKYNLQLNRGESTTKPLEATIAAALGRNATFARVALPKSVTPPMFNRYEPGMKYDRHVDNPVMANNQLRADLSVTVFLSEPDSYDGGELCIEADTGVQEIKLTAGEAVVYPSGMSHWVAPVTRGARFAAVVWVQSLVRDHTMRRVLHDVNLVLGRLGETDPESETAQTLSHAYTNLVRLVVDL
jgi:PKHD-type hydroxylase